MSNTQNLYKSYQQTLKKIADVKYAAALLQWDQETYMPANGAAIRGQQMGTLLELAQEWATTNKLKKLLLNLLDKNDLTPTQKHNVALSWYDFQKAVKLPPKFVRKSTEIINQSFHAWIAARKQNDFSVFEKPLQKVIEMKRAETQLLGFEQHSYNALLNEYDKGLTVPYVENVFQNLKPGLLKLYNAILQKPEVEDHFLKQFFPKEKQWELGLDFLKKMHYQFNAGRQDISEHPFTTSFGATDVRVTTHITENDFGNMLWSCLHEGGHALYEQGLPNEQYGLPLGEYCSLSIHESQSRLWENGVGRSKAFWQFHYPGLQNYFPEQLKNVSLQNFYKGINKVQPSLIRTQADEITYHFHVMIRYEIEKQLIAESIQAKDIPAVWNSYYKEYLNIEVPNAKEGCLQDVHWSHGSFGYFATYSLGSLYAAQIYAAIQKQMPSLNTEVANGNVQPILTWLQQHIFKYGRQYPSAELCKKATGEILNSQYFLNYAHQKYAEIYTI